MLNSKCTREKTLSGQDQTRNCTGNTLLKSQFLNLELGVRENKSALSSTTFLPQTDPSFTIMWRSGTMCVPGQHSGGMLSVKCQGGEGGAAAAAFPCSSPFLCWAGLELCACSTAWEAKCQQVSGCAARWALLPLGTSWPEHAEPTSTCN